MMYKGLFGIDYRNAVRLETDVEQLREMAELGFEIADLQDEQAAQVAASIEEKTARLERLLEPERQMDRVIRSIVGEERYRQYMEEQHGTADGREERGLHLLSPGRGERAA